MSDHQFATSQVHAGFDPGANADSVTPVIYSNAAFWLENSQRGHDVANGDIPGFLYSRVSNPTVSFLEKRIAELDGAKEAVAVASGMAAITYAILNAAEGGGRIIAPYDVYGGTFDSLRTLLPQFGVHTDFVEDINDIDHIESLIGDPNNTGDTDVKAIFAESVSNPTTVITDVEALAELAHRHGIPLIIDNTLPTPYLYRPLEHGADIVVYSTTKALSGHGNAIGGVVTSGDSFDWANGRYPQFTEPEYILGEAAGRAPRSFAEAAGPLAFIRRLRLKYLRLTGAVLGPFEAYLQLIGLETLSERVSKETASATAVAKYLSQQPHVTKVNYSGLPGSAQADLVAEHYPLGIGSVLSFELEGGAEQTAAFINSVKLFSYLANIGDARSLIVDPVNTTHREFTQEARTINGVDATTIRLSIGLENPDDIIADLEHAFQKVYA
ncbi:O-acetylhomoserine aminocarboxypropyltransferase/cysteine synthase [Bifidobacterium reuteri]|uniref:homocysteine desulfhydrase n=1 Tax=Bifidobacterium reuteri TaxID=983706 RepID=A0A5J5E8J5_9BIFI|nr:aminotransferase class I/II-fold pyridoxal phosphate-dependent enzyme [Bifidobacterium reuteri]KAA8825302.1 O-acetylhomoserine aminocarboxypropyltransferase/cysteine synthase [Bifidobacterium reuteri]